MTETSVSTPDDWLIDQTSDGLIRLSTRDHVSLWTPYEFSRMSVQGCHIAQRITFDRLPETQEPIVRSPVYGPPSY